MASVSLAAVISGLRSPYYLASFPTDTVPALAARPDAAELIYQAKSRQADKPLILMAATPEAIWPYVQGDESEWAIWQQVAAQYWPGALTLVLPASSRLPTAMNPTNPTTLGIRVPNSDLARDILSQTGPLATTSVNRSGQPPLLTPDQINEHFPQVLTPPQHLWPHPHLAGIPSTVASWTGTSWISLRSGEIDVTGLPRL